VEERDVETERETDAEQVAVVAGVSASATYLSMFLRMDTTDLLAALYSDCKCVSVPVSVPVPVSVSVSVSLCVSAPPSSSPPSTPTASQGPLCRHALCAYADPTHVQAEARAERWRDGGPAHVQAHALHVPVGVR
jgi:hypothetical protein